MRRWVSWRAGIRLSVGLALLVAVLGPGRSYLMPGTVLVPAPPALSGAFPGRAPVALAAPKEPLTEQTIYPAQASWAWISSEDHEGSPDVLRGTSCLKCHKDDSAVRAALWPRWAAPPSDHKQTLGCQTCHGVVATPGVQ